MINNRERTIVREKVSDVFTSFVRGKDTSVKLYFDQGVLNFMFAKEENVPEVAAVVDFVIEYLTADPYWCEVLLEETAGNYIITARWPQNKFIDYRHV